MQLYSIAKVQKNVNESFSISLRNNFFVIVIIPAEFVQGNGGGNQGAEYQINIVHNHRYIAIQLISPAIILNL